ncbi:MAG TPA: beta-xylosidase [Terracidiphilus sp.]|nr:beta-xylosidase [Terracidiphilus sp.]
MRSRVSPILLIACFSLFPARAARAQASPAPPETAAARIRVDLNAPVAPFRPIYANFGYDEANYTTTPHGRALLRELHDLTPVPVHIRVHHLLTSGNGEPELKFSSTNVYTEDSSGNPHYDFTILDGIFDAWKQAGVRPLVELGFMPRDLAATEPGKHQPYEVHFPGSTIAGASNNPPKNYKRWEALVHAVVAHLVQRYGRAEVLQWDFEVWNEPDIPYWHGSEQDYFNLYDYAVAGARAALPGARVGGPATTGPSGPHWRKYLKDFLDHVAHGRSAATGGPVPLDFISFHAKGSPVFHDGTVTMGLSHELSDVDNGFALVASMPRFRHVPILLTEADPEGCAACSARNNPANNYRNDTLYPAYTAAAFKAMLDLERQHGVNLAAMLSWSFEFENHQYFEGFRTLSTNGIDKPILNLFRMLGLMSGERVRAKSSSAIPLETLVNKGAHGTPVVDALATRGDHEAAVLTWNYGDENETRPATPTEVEVQGIPPGVHRVLLETYRIDHTHSNAYTAWLAMGSPQEPTTAQYEQLKQAGQLDLFTSPQWLDVRNGTAAIRINQPYESVSLLRLSWKVR